MRWLLSAIILISCSDVYADSLSKAKLYLQAGFPEESKREIIRNVVLTRQTVRLPKVIFCSDSFWLKNLWF